MDSPTAATSAAVFAALLAAYARTAYPSVPGGDSGELLAEACALGVAHPPGYPLFLYLARASMALLPASLGSPAHRANLGCCALGAAAGALLHAASARLAARLAPRLPAWFVQCVCAGAALAWGLSPLIWLYHIGAEVFALSNFFVAALLLAGAAWGDAVVAAAAEGGGGGGGGGGEAAAAAAAQRVLRGAHALALLCGLALTNQHTALLLVVPLAVWVAAAPPAASPARCAAPPPWRWLAWRACCPTCTCPWRTPCGAGGAPGATPPPWRAWRATFCAQTTAPFAW